MFNRSDISSLVIPALIIQAIRSSQVVKIGGLGISTKIIDDLLNFSHYEVSRRPEF